MSFHSKFIYSYPIIFKRNHFFILMRLEVSIKDLTFLFQFEVVIDFSKVLFCSEDFSLY